MTYLNRKFGIVVENLQHNVSRSCSAMLFMASWVKTFGSHFENAQNFDNHQTIKQVVSRCYFQFYNYSQLWQIPSFFLGPRVLIHRTSIQLSPMRLVRCQAAKRPDLDDLLGGLILGLG